MNLTVDKWWELILKVAAGRLRHESVVSSIQ